MRAGGGGGRFDAGGGGARFAELRMDRVSRSFAGRFALADLELAIKGGEFVALLGPSGCGKSTALNCLAGLLPLTAGSIWMDGRRIDGLPPEARGFGMVFQNYALFPHMSVRRNIAFGLRMRRLPKEEIRRRVDAAVRLVQLEEHAAKFPGQLSGGQQQRVAIARAVVLEPPLVLMDEPLSNLDAKLRLEMRTEIKRLHQSLGLTTVYVTHDQEEALSLADRLVVLRDGRVQQVGTPEEVYVQPRNRYVAGFMGYRNELELPVVAADGGLVTLSGGGITLTGQRRDDDLGDTAVAAIRPEDVLVDPRGNGDDSGDSGDSGDPMASGASAAAGASESAGAAGALASGNRIPVTVEVVEYRGREQSVQLRTAGGHALHARTDRRLAPGDTVTVSVPVERVLVFSAGSPAAPAEVT